MPESSMLSSYESFIHSASMARISVSLRSVSLKPGVSTRRTDCSPSLQRTSSISIVSSSKSTSV